MKNARLQLLHIFTSILFHLFLHYFPQVFYGVQYVISGKEMNTQIQGRSNLLAIYEYENLCSVNSFLLKG